MRKPLKRRERGKMEKYVPYEKLSKKKRRALNRQRREIWSISPVTRKPDHPKAYNRRKARKQIDYDPISVPFLCDVFVVLSFRC